MEEFIIASLENARKYFGRLGFNETQIETLLASAERDLRKELGRLKEILIASTPDAEGLNNSLHAIKGLLLNMGNTEAAKLFTELRADLQSSEGIEKIKKLLGVA